MPSLLECTFGQVRTVHTERVMIMTIKSRNIAVTYNDNVVDPILIGAEKSNNQKQEID